MTENSRNDLTIYDGAAANWWYDDIRLVHSSKDLVPGRLGWFDKHVDWNRLTILDLGCAPGGAWPKRSPHAVPRSQGSTQRHKRSMPRGSMRPKPVLKSNTMLG